MTDPFESPKFLIRQTRVNITEFEGLATTFRQINGGVEREDIDPKTRNHIHKVCFSAFPERLRHIAASAITDMRHALDQATCIAVELVTGHSASDKLYFPIATNPNDLKGRIRTDIPPELHTIFEGFQSYPTGTGYAGGNDFICDLNKAAKRKHRVSCGVGADVRHWGLGTVEIGVGVKFPIFEWNAANNELIVAIAPHGSQFNADIDLAFFISLQNAGPLTGRAVLSVINDAATVVEHVVLGLEAECRRLGFLT